MVQCWHPLKQKDAGAPAMTIDWAHFTPWASLGGGLLIGIACAALVLVSGRILGISGILGGLLPPHCGNAGWRVSVLLGMLAAPAAVAWLAPAGWVDTPRIEASQSVLLGAGLLVGFGTRLGSGCTSGHGVCGLSRLSLRSLVATLSFMVAGIVVVFLIRHLL
jgi:uncharacterized protein